MTRSELRELSQEILQLYGDPEVYELCNSLSPERRCHFLDTFQDFLQDRYRDLLMDELLSGQTKAVRQARCPASKEADPLEVFLSHSVGNLTVPKLRKDLQVKHIRNFGSHSWGSDLFEKQKELAAFAWPKGGTMGTWPMLTHSFRRRPCGVTESGRTKSLEKLVKIGASEIAPFFFPEEAATCWVTLVTEPSMSLAGQVMSIARDGEGTLERIFLDDQLPPEASSEVAQARFAKGTKLTIVEPMLLVNRDGLRGIAVQAGEVRRLAPGIDPAHARAAGNRAVAKQNYAAAAELYCIGLQHADLDLLVTILSNRCQAHLKTREYGAAVCDAALVLQMRFHDAKAWARYSQALRGLKAEHLALRVDGSVAEAFEVEAEWRSVTEAAVKAAICYAAKGPCDVVKVSSLVAAKRAVENAKEAANNEYKREEFVAAVEGYTRALACDPVLEDATAILGNLAHCRLCLGQPHCAMAAAAACLRLKPGWAMALKAAHRLSAALAAAGELAIADEITQQFETAVPTDDVGLQTAQRQSEKLVHVRSLLAQIREGHIIQPESLCTLNASMGIDLLGPIQLKDGIRTTQKVEQGALLLLVRPLGGLCSEGESRTFEERMLQRIQHSNVLCQRLSYFCSTDMATNEVASWLSKLKESQPPSLGALLISSRRSHLLPMLGQRCEVLSCDQPVDYSQLDDLIRCYRRSLAGSTKRSYGIFPALEVMKLEDPEVGGANCRVLPCGEALLVLAADELQSEQELLLPAGFEKSGQNQTSSNFKSDIEQ